MPIAQRIEVFPKDLVQACAIRVDVTSVIQRHEPFLLQCCPAVAFGTTAYADAAGSFSP